MGKTVAQLVADSLIENGMTSLYCVPGVQNDEFFDALHHRGNRIRAIHARHEQGAVFMALGAALATGRPQAFSIVPGPGFLNGASALCTAYAVNAPLFGLIGQIPFGALGKEFGELHEINDQIGIIRRLTKFGIGIASGEEAVDGLARAWSELRAGRPRPVGVEIPVDVWSQEAVAALPLTAGPPSQPEINPVQIRAAAELIAESARPLIVVGGGAQDHAESLRDLAETIGAGVIANRNGHGVMPSGNPLCLNTPAGHRLWPDCDLVIGLGSRLATQKLNWGTDERLGILHIDIDPAELNRVVPATVGIHADLGDALPLIRAELRNSDRRPAWRRRMQAAKQAVQHELGNELAPQLEWLNAIRSALPDRGILVDELTQIGFVARFAFPVHHPRTFLSSGYQGTLGWGLAAAMGAAHACPGVPVVSVAGDGGGLFTIGELATAAHHQIPVNTIIMNDHAYGNVKGFQRDRYGGRFIASELTSPDFAALGRSFGIQSHRAASPAELHDRLEQAIANPGPNLIEVPVDEFPSPWRFINLPKVRQS